MATLQQMMRNALGAKPETKPVLDSAKRDEIYLDSAADYTERDIKLKAVGAVQEWLEDDDLDDGENYADRLLALMIGIADANKDGDLDDDETEVLDIALEAAWDYLSNNGADDDDIDALLNDWDEDAAERIRDLAIASVPDGDDAVDAFVFGPGDQDAVFDATYKKRVAVRGGKKVRINKRVSGTVRLTAKQKVAIRKAQRKSHNAAAMIKRRKSMKKRRQMGL